MTSYMAAGLKTEPKVKRPAGQPCCEPLVHPGVTPARADRMAAVARALRKHAGKVCVCELTPLFDVSQPTVSHHLKVLREAGLVDVERRGLWAYYYVIPETTKELSTWLR